MIRTRKEINKMKSFLNLIIVDRNDNKTKNIIKDLFCAVEEIEVEDEESETEIWLREQNERLQIEIKRLKEDLKELSNLVYGKESKKN